MIETDETGSERKSPSSSPTNTDQAPSIEACSFPDIYPTPSQKACWRNYLLFSFFCSAVPASALACLALATAELKSMGAWQSSVLYTSYTLTSVRGISTVGTHRWGSKRTLVTGQALFGGGYVALFWLAVLVDRYHANLANLFALMGAAVGGVGASFLWTAQGVYFVEAVQDYARHEHRQQKRSGDETVVPQHPLRSYGSEPYSPQQPGLDLRDRERASSLLSGAFALCFLVEEVTLDILSTLLVKFMGVSWNVVFFVYAGIALAATGLLSWNVHNYRHVPGQISTSTSAASCWSTWKLFGADARIRYMMGFMASFAVSGALINSYVSGQVVEQVLGDTAWVGVLVAWHGVAAALCSIVFAQQRRKGFAMILGSVALASVSLLVMLPNPSDWVYLVALYGLQGVGRAAFEGPLKALFADWFPHAKEAAFTQITLQHGVASSLAYVMTVSWPTEYGSGDMILAWMGVAAGVASLAGYTRASRETERGNFAPVEPDSDELDLPQIE